MGSCLCKGHKELHNAQPQSLEPCVEAQPINKGDYRPCNGNLSEAKSNSAYGIGELATSSILGLVATIKEHITKPTAMAQGRVAHLIEWKSWGRESTVGGGWCGWNQAGGVGAALHEHQQLYSHLTDEVKEARFAAGVAEQFALAEATIDAWSLHNVPDPLISSSTQLQDSEGIFLSQLLMDGGGAGTTQRLYSVQNLEPSPDCGSQGPPPQTHSCSPSSLYLLESQLPPEARRNTQPDDTIRYADSISFSEDEVFYN
ncbi:protein FAM131C [Denticeps clupeoides]|uniref:Family with sequence similarity 131 member C n=1 Tax=Denticeps clupeoides TaxID=299321 RepID=A0AAY4B665_9TELE|nr:protein FAM131C [Denticeps clupeoides]